MRNLNADLVEAVQVIEADAANDGLVVLPATQRNYTALQVTLQRLLPELQERGYEPDPANVQIVQNLAGKPLLFLLDLRRWPEDLERRFLARVSGVKCGLVPERWRGVAALGLPIQKQP